MRVVIGAGTDALRSAAVLAASGQAVLLLQECDTPYGLDHPDLPEGLGRMYVDPSDRQVVESAVGALVEAPTLSRAIAVRGQIHSIPMAIGTVPQLFEGVDLSLVGRGFLERRIRNALIPLTGGGQEERTYRQWVERRMGAAAYEHIYSDYARRRWALAGDHLSVAVARSHHNPHRVEPGQVTGGGTLAALAHAVSVIESNGGEIRCGAKVRGLKVVDGKVVAARVGRRNIPVEGPVWIARPHRVVAGWLGDALSAPRHVDANALQVWDRLQIALPIGDCDLPDEIHVLDRAAPAWRISQVYGGGSWAVFHSNVAPDQAAPAIEEILQLGQSLGMRGLEIDGARVERIREWVPLWAPVVHPRLRRLALAWSDLGIAAVGRRGTFTPVDSGAEIAVSARYAHESGLDGREVLRSILEPPVKDDDLDASFRDFIWS